MRKTKAKQGVFIVDRETNIGNGIILEPGDRIILKSEDKLTIDTPSTKPKNKSELRAIIRLAIKEQGHTCNLNFIDTSLITDMSGVFKRTNLMEIFLTGT